MTIKPLKLNLLENAKSSLHHAVLHLSDKKIITVDDYKYAIRDVVHAIELLFKEKLKRVHPAFMWRDVDKYPNEEAYTVTIDEAKNRLAKIANVNFTQKHKENIESIKKLRNEIEHYEFEIDETLAKTHIGRMLSFIFWFSGEHLELGWEYEFKKDDSWLALISIHQFFEEHVEVVEARMINENRNVTDCPSCGGYTFDFDEEECEICGENLRIERCENCERQEFEYKLIDYYNGPCCNLKKICKWCAAPPYEND